MKKTLLTIFAVIILLCISYSSFTKVSADDYAPQYEYSIEFNNGNVFFMYPITSENDNYLKSGLYYNKEQTEVIYLLNTPSATPYYLYKSELIFTTNGLSFAQIPWATAEYGNTNGIALQFYNNGILIKQYSVKDLITYKIALEFSVSHVRWESTDLRVFDEIANTLKITALDGTITEFNLLNGDIIHKKNSYSIYIWLLIFLIVFSFVTIIIYILYKKKHIYK